MAIRFDPATGQFVEVSDEELWRTRMGEMDATAAAANPWTARMGTARDAYATQLKRTAYNQWRTSMDDKRLAYEKANWVAPEPNYVQDQMDWINGEARLGQPNPGGATPEEKANWVAPERNYEQEQLDWINGEATLGARYPLPPTGGNDWSTGLQPDAYPYRTGMASLSPTGEPLTPPSGDTWTYGDSNPYLSQEERNKKLDWASSREKTASKYGTVQSLLGSVK